MLWRSYAGVSKSLSLHLEKQAYLVSAIKLYEKIGKYHFQFSR